MNDYIAKPVDERLLYSKIVGLVKKPEPVKQLKATKKKHPLQSRCIDLDYLIHRTKSDSQMMMDMISIYLEQTPPLVNAMKQHFQDKDWKALHSVVHKMIPSFSIMGISSDFENMAKKIQDAATQQQVDGIHDMILRLDTVCAQACRELEEEFNRMKQMNS